MPEDNPANRIIILAYGDWNNRQKVEAAKVFAVYAEGLAKTLASLKNLSKSRSLDDLIQTEDMLVLQERALYGKQDPSVLGTLNAAVADFDVIKKSSKTVRSAEEYRAAATTYHAKKTFQGVVADGCHEALNGHITRLGNRMSAVGISVPEKNVLRQRQANIRVVKELYIDLQRKALGIEAPVKEQGFER